MIKKEKTCRLINLATPDDSKVNTRGTEKNKQLYRGADKSLVRPTSRCILFDGENISFDASLVIYI
jgi:hypothetical protein